MISARESSEISKSIFADGHIVYDNIKKYSEMIKINEMISEVCLLLILFRSVIIEIFS